MPSPSPSRLEAFSDGVIAVIITIMVLELHVPKADGLPGFLSILPTLGVYALSFTFTGIYWINHHHMIDRLRRVDHLILWTNLFFLFCLSLLPFFTNYLVEKHLDSFSVALYAASLFVDGAAFTLLGRAVIRHLRAAAARLDAEAYTPAQAQREARHQLSEMRKGLFSVTFYFLAILLASRYPHLALALIALVTVIWIIPTFGIRPVDPDHTHPA